MRPREFIAFLGGAAMGWPLETQAQPCNAHEISLYSGLFRRLGVLRAAALRLRVLGW
jgi:hypothetical protein